MQEVVEQLAIPNAVYFLALLIVLELLLGLLLATVIPFVYSLKTVALMLTKRALVSLIACSSDGRQTALWRAEEARPVTFARSAGPPGAKIHRPIHTEIPRQLYD